MFTIMWRYPNVIFMGDDVRVSIQCVATGMVQLAKRRFIWRFFFYIMLRFRENQVIWSVIWRNFISHILSTFLSRMIVLWMLGHPVRRSSAFLHRNVVKPICKEASNTVFDLTILHYIATKCCRKNQSV